MKSLWKQSIFLLLVLAMSTVTFGQPVNGEGFWDRRNPNAFETWNGFCAEKFDTAEGWTPTKGTAAIDPTHFSEGLFGLEIVTDPGDSGEAFKRPLWNVSSWKNFSVDVYIESPDTWTGEFPDYYYTSPKIEIVLRSNASGGMFLTGYSGNLHRGWNRVIMSRMDFIPTGGMTWDEPVGMFIFRVKRPQQGTPVSNLVHRVTFDNFRVNDKEDAVVVFSFDDGWIEHHTHAFPYLQQKGLRGTVSINAGLLSTGEFMSPENVTEIYNAGWDVCNHTWVHGWGGESTFRATESYQQNIDYFVEHSWTRNNCHKHAIFPAGLYNPAVLEALMNLGMLTGRTTNNFIMSNRLDPTDAYSIYTLSRWQAGGSFTLEFIKNKIDAVVARGGKLELNFHRIVPGPVQFEADTNYDDFKSMVDYVALKRAQGKLTVMTPTEWYEFVTSN